MACPIEFIIERFYCNNFTRRLYVLSLRDEETGVPMEVNPSVLLLEPD